MILVENALCDNTKSLGGVVYIDFSPHELKSAVEMADGDFSMNSKDDW